MNLVCAIGKTVPEAYHSLLYHLLACGAVNEKGDMECTAVMKVESPLAEPRISRMFPGGSHELEQYRQEILDGILDFEVEEGLWPYTYHQRFAPWLAGVVKELERDDLSRRAVISVRDNGADMGSEDPACMQSLQFQLRNGKLEMTVFFRSNDAVRALFMNTFGLTCLQQAMAEQLGAEVGEYTLFCGNMHCYKESIPTLESYVKRIKSRKDLYYDYEGFYDELMKAERPAIDAMVAEQMRKAAENRICCANCWRDCVMVNKIDAFRRSCFDFIGRERK